MQQQYTCWRCLFSVSTIVHVTPQETKDIETAVAGIRADKVKAEAAEKAAKLKGARMLWLFLPEPHGEVVLQTDRRKDRQPAGPMVAWIPPAMPGVWRDPPR